MKDDNLYYHNYILRNAGHCMIQVEITNLNPEIKRWRVEEVQRKLKDFYFPYIQVLFKHLS